MSKKISELTQANTIANTDLIPVVVNPSNTSTIETKNVTAANLVISVMPAVPFFGANGVSVVSNTTGVTVTNSRPLQNTVAQVAADFGTAILANTDIFQITLAGANGVITTASGNTVTFSINASALVANNEIANGSYTVANNTLVLNKTGGQPVNVQLTGVANTSSLPANTSDLVNDSGFITSSSLPANTSAASGAYTVANNTLVVTRDDSSTFSVVLTGLANSSSLPANTSDLTNDSGFITTSSLPANTSLANGTFTVANNTLTITRADSSTEDIDLTGIANTSQIPSAVSALTNDTGYITSSALPANTSTTSATLDANTYVATFTRDDSSTFTLNLADFTIASYQTFANSTANASVEINQLFFDDNFFYVATANGTVKRTTLSSF
jgi:hypothetical protein